MSMNDFSYLGYKYNEFSFLIPKENANFFDQNSIFGVRDYILDGHVIEISLNPSNRNKNDVGYCYQAKTDILPLEKQTEDSIGILKVVLLNKNDEIVERHEVNMMELDNSHVIDLLLGTIIDLHHKKFGPGPHESPKARTKKPSLKR